MYCSKCGREVEETALKCPYCETDLKKWKDAPTINIVNSNANANTNMFPGYVLKKKSVALLLAIFLGWLGVHRFYVGKTMTGILWLLTFGLCGVGWAVDVILILTGSFRDAARMPLA